MRITKIIGLFVFCNFISITHISQIIYKDVAPIFYHRCANCHNPENQFPFLNYYSSIKQFKGLIQLALESNKMPPWPPDTAYSRFSHERIITLPEKTKLLTWINNNAPFGATLSDTSLAPPSPTYSKFKLYGNPDLVVTIPSFTSNATTNDTYNCYSIPLNLTQNRILKAYEVIPNNPTLIHHAVFNVDTIGNSTDDLTGGCFNISTGFNIGDYAPGANPIVFPSNNQMKFGITIKAGSKLIVQMHYPAGSAGKVDKTQIRLFFYPVSTTNVRQLTSFVPLQNWAFSIPPNSLKTVTVTFPPSAITTPSPVSIISAFPHSHKLCTYIENYAKTGALTTNLIRINKWDFNWQGVYTYPKMLKIPTGSKLYAIHTFSNNTGNTVSAGFNTYDEMIFDGYIFANYLPGDENIDLTNMLINDPLLNTPSTLNSIEPIQLKVFPNPFNQIVQFQYANNANHFSALTIFDNLGKEVITLYNPLKTGTKHTFIWDGKNHQSNLCAPASYIYKLFIGGSVYSGQIQLN